MPLHPLAGASGNRPGLTLNWQAGQGDRRICNKLTGLQAALLSGTSLHVASCFFPWYLESWVLGCSVPQLCEARFPLQQPAAQPGQPGRGHIGLCREASGAQNCGPTSAVPAGPGGQRAGPEDRAGGRDGGAETVPALRSVSFQVSSVGLRGQRALSPLSFSSRGWGDPGVSSADARQDGKEVGRRWEEI